ncbi:MAG: tetrahydrofolate dehydrogenase/cyclohydrolase catalytic domain-containing protein, partial [Adlercreutzia sp.]|nr:tetrahydrofolate dehydrogenase/cyclohydrolase catalytic domain-containing protein [Adlercreutzia sp.]
MARILYGKEVSSALWKRLLPRIDRLRAHGVAPTLAIVRVGERPDDLSYERTCARQADLHGIAVRRFVLPADATQAELEAVIDLVNADARIHGCLMFRPLPASMNERAVCDRLTPVKDIDGIGSASLAGVFADTGEGFPPATAQACLETL